MIKLRGKVYHGIFYLGGKPVWRTLSTANETQANINYWNKYQDLKDKNRTGKGLKKIPWKAFCEEFIKSLKAKGRNLQTIESYERTIRFFNQTLESPFLDAEDLDFTHLDNFILQRREWKYERKWEHRVNNSGLNKDISNLKAMTRWGEIYPTPKKPYIKVDPLRRYKLLDMPKSQPKNFSEKQMRQIWEEGVIDEFEDLFVSLFYYTGRRRSELTNLKQTQVDFTRHVIHRSAVTSNKKNQGIIPMVPELEGKLKAWIASNPHENVLHLNDRKLDDAYATKLFKKIMKRAGIEEEGSVHRLRHSFGDRLSEKGFNQHQIALLMGHSRTQTTDIYTNGVIRDIEGLRKAMSEALAAPLP